MGDGAAGGLWRHQQCRHLGCHLGFYQELELRLKPLEIVVFLCFTWKITCKWTLRIILATIFTFIVERSWKNIFTQRWLDPLLLMTLYLTTMATDHKWTCLKMCARDERTATENVRCWCFILWEKKNIQKNLGIGPYETRLEVKPKCKLL